MLLIEQFEEVGIKNSTKRGLTPIVMIIGIKGNLSPRLRSHSEVVPINNIETDKLDSVVDKMLTNIELVIRKCH